MLAPRFEREGIDDQIVRLTIYRENAVSVGTVTGAPEAARLRWEAQPTKLPLDRCANSP